MIRVIGWIVVAFVVIVMTINAAFMLISPRAWFRLPVWLRAQGTLTEDRYSAGWGAVQLRIAGALMLGSIGWVAYAMLH
jgi:hypothetical protein